MQIMRLAASVLPQLLYNLKKKKVLGKINGNNFVFGIFFE